MKIELVDLQVTIGNRLSFALVDRTDLILFVGSFETCS